MTDTARTAADIAASLQPLGPRSIHAHVSRPILQQLCESGAHTVMEMGCGNGWFTAALGRCGFDVVGVDRNQALLERAASEHTGVRFRHWDLTQDPEPGLTARFDAVVAIDVIDHMPQPRKLIEAALHVLKPGGVLIVTAPYYGYLKNVALALTGRFDLRWDPLLDEGRLKFYSRATLTALLSEFELRDVQFKTVGRIPVIARSMVISAGAPD